MSANTETGLGTLYEVTCSRNGSLLSFYIAAHEYDRIDAIWGDYVESGKTRDRKIEVECQDGDPLAFLLSDVFALEKSTRDGRRRIRERDQAFAAEKREDGLFDGGIP